MCRPIYHLNYSIALLVFKVKMTFSISINCCSRLFSLHMSATCIPPLNGIILLQSLTAHTHTRMYGPPVAQRSSYHSTSANFILKKTNNNGSRPGAECHRSLKRAGSLNRLVCDRPITPVSPKIPTDPIHSWTFQFCF